MSNTSTYSYSDGMYDVRDDIHSDCVILRNPDKTITERIKSWKGHSKELAVSCPLTCGIFLDYLNGKTDGKQHWDLAQKTKTGNYVLLNTVSPYVVPSFIISEYLVGLLKPVVDAGITKIFIEHAEYPVVSGYSDAFKRIWRVYYKCEWIPPHTSVDAQMMASKLKSYLLAACVEHVASRIRNYALTRFGKQISIYLALPSLIDCIKWGIVYPDMARVTPFIDGIAGILSNDAFRFQNEYNGELRKRVFQNALIETESLVQAAKHYDLELFLVDDPAGNNQSLNWKDCRKDNQKVINASFFTENVESGYSLCPYPGHMFSVRYPRSKQMSAIEIPEEFKLSLTGLSGLSTDFNRSMSDYFTNGAKVAVLVSQNAVFQRKYSDSDAYSVNLDDNDHLSDFYGLVLPFIQNGIKPVPVQIEWIDEKDVLSPFDILIVSFDFMKPCSPAETTIISEWVRRGGILLYIGDSKDPFNKEKAWWNTGNINYDSPADYLVHWLGISGRLDLLRKKKSISANIRYFTSDCGKGTVVYVNENASRFCKSSDSAVQLRKILLSACERRSVPLTYRNCFVCRRGPYISLSVLDSDLKDNFPINGLFLDLYSDMLETDSFFVAEPGNFYLLYDLNTVDKDAIKVIYSTAYIERIVDLGEYYTFFTLSEEKDHCRYIINCPPDCEVMINDVPVQYRRDESGRTIRIEHAGGNNRITIHRLS